MFNTTSKQADDGVSPVIGVILMVAITVILAAVIGTFVLDLAGNLQQSAQASVTFDEDTNTDEVVVQAVSMQSADFVEVRASSDGTGGGSTELSLSGSGSADSLGGSADSDTIQDLGSVGTTETLDYNAGAGSATAGTITAVGYLEGEGSVLQTYDYGG